MRIAYVTGEYARPSDTFIREEVWALRDLGHEVFTFSVRRPLEPPGEAAVQRERDSTDYILEHGMSRLAAATRRHPPARLAEAARFGLAVGSPGLRGRLWPAAYLLESAYLAERMHALEIEHLHDHISEGSAVVAAMASMLSGIPFSMTVHGPVELERAPTLALDVKAREAAFVVSISEFARGQLMRWVRPSEWHKLHVLRCGAPRRVLDRPEEPLPDVSRFVAIGRLSSEKGHLVLVDALARLASEGIAAEVTLIGDGPLRRLIQARARDLKVEDRLHLTGWLPNDDAAAELAKARALVLPSFAEGLPITVMESLALHRPVIATAIAAIPELVEHGRHGWLVPPGSVDRLADAMRTALATPVADLARMGAAGAARVAERHDTHTEAARLAALFEASRR